MKENAKKNNNMKNFNGKIKTKNYRQFKIFFLFLFHLPILSFSPLLLHFRFQPTPLTINNQMIGLFFDNNTTYSNYPQ